MTVTTTLYLDLNSVLAVHFCVLSTYMLIQPSPLSQWIYIYMSEKFIVVCEGARVRINWWMPTSECLNSQVKIKLFAEGKYSCCGLTVILLGVSFTLSNEFYTESAKR